MTRTRIDAGPICNFLEKIGVSYKDKMQMLFAAIAQNAHEPDQGEYIISELRELIAMIRGQVLNHAEALGFFHGRRIGAVS